jgi:hypothetical protein
MNDKALAIQDGIDRFIDYAKDQPQIEMPTDHWLILGMYARRILIPAQTVFVGRVHKKPHFFITAMGVATISTDDGFQRVNAPSILCVAPGTKRVGVAHTDCVFITVHRTDETDLKAIAEDLVEYDPRARYDEANNIVQLKELL